jgi:hypothetical protein
MAVAPVAPAAHTALGCTVCQLLNTPNNRISHRSVTFDHELSRRGIASTQMRTVCAYRLNSTFAGQLLAQPQTTVASKCGSQPLHCNSPVSTTCGRLIA